MSLNSNFRRTVAAVGIAASLIAPFASSADAQSRHGPGGPGYGAPAPRQVYPAPHHAPPPVYHERRHNNGDKIAKGIAIGVGAAILGAILINEANRRPHLPD